MTERRQLNVLFDEQIFLLQVHGGISRYYIELIKQFRSRPELGVIPVITQGRVLNGDFARELGGENKQTLSKFGSLFELLRVVFRPKLSAGNLDVVHATFYLPFYFKRFKGVPKVTTLFDMIPEFTDKKLFRPRNPHFRKRAYIKNSDGVLSISEASVVDMRKKYGFTFPVQTTYLGVSSEFRPGIRRNSSLPDRYFLFVGNRGGYKNASLALDAFARVAIRNPHLSLVFCGGGTFSKTEQRAIKVLGIDDKVVQYTANSGELPAIYSNALGLVYPTKYEGFGLPLVEAMASGIPVFASSIPINYEIAESAVSYFDPNSSSDLAELMQYALNGEPELKTKVVAGLERAKHFSWYRCAELTAKIYREVALNKGRSS